tara:strand:- start:193 stop:396 length:204 start_codon:yes stop_codon:yes gene_type:complete
MVTAASSEEDSCILYSSELLALEEACMALSGTEDDWKMSRCAVRRYDMILILKILLEEGQDQTRISD